MAFGDYFNAGRAGGQSGLGNFIREKLDVARKAGLVGHQAKAYGDQNVRATTAAQKAKMDAFAPFNQQVLEQMYGTGIPGQYDFTKPNVTTQDGMPIVGNVTQSGGMLLPKYSVRTPLDALEERIRATLGRMPIGGDTPPQDIQENFMEDTSEVEQQLLQVINNINRRAQGAQ